MWKKIAVAGGTAVVILGGGTAAWAAGANGSPAATPTASSTTSAPSTGPSAGTGHDRQRADHPLRRALHAQWVTRDGKSGSFITHDEIRGQVTAVSATSITVRAADNFSRTYALNGQTKVHTRAQHTGASITDVHKGDPVRVLGTGTSTLTATQVVDAKKQPTAQATATATS